VLTKGEPVSAPRGRADDFSWPHGGADNADPAAVEPAPEMTPISPAMPAKPGRATQRAR
jgi:hypothetical protein